MAERTDLQKNLADQLWAAEQSQTPVEPLKVQYPELTLEDAYAIQLVNYEKKLAQGEVVTGKKIGLTSLAMQQSMGVDTPDFGILLDSMRVEGGVIQKGQVIQPRVEGELAFVMKEDLRGDVTAEDVLAATDYITPSIEVVDSRIKDWKLTIVDTVADNASCGMYVESGIRIDPKDAIEDIHMVLYKNGEKINEGYGRDVMGHPVHAVVWLVKCLAAYGVTVDKGDFVLAGALTAAIPAEPGDSFEIEFVDIGSVAVAFEE